MPIAKTAKILFDEFFFENTVLTFTADTCDGIFLSNGPGDPQMCDKTVQNIRKLLKSKPNMPIFGICLGHQLLSVAIGCETKKMNYGHRGHNQPCQFLKTNRY